MQREPEDEVALENQELDLETHAEIDPEDLQPRAWEEPSRSRVLIALGVLVTLLAITVIPPLISVNRFRRQIAGGVSASLGRPVHMDAVTLNVLPLPGFTLENFVVGEDPAFGSEPVIQAKSVRVTLRVWSLWRRRVEFSRISLEEPSVNLVHRADGRWNLESILLQASRIEAAPTAQKGAGDAPRFPYIEATGARVNVKMGLEKMPLALTEADFALWLPQPQQWRLRLEGHPARTDTAATDTGTFRVQGTLGKAATLKDVPVDLTAEWLSAPLGGVSRVLMGRDAGMRGQLTLDTSMKGTVGDNTLVSRLQLNRVRRADFVPLHSLDADLTCIAQVTGVFHQLNDVHCAWPAGVAADTGLTVLGALPEVSRPRTFTADGTLAGVSAASLLDLLRVASPRVSPELAATGVISAKLACCGKDAGGWLATSGRAAISKASLTLGAAKPFFAGDVAGDIGGGALSLRPLTLDLGAPQPAALEGHADANGYALHLTGPALRSRLLLLAQAVPQFGDGLEEALPSAPEPGTEETPIRVDLVSSRAWTGGQRWSTVAARPVKHSPRRR